MLRIVLDTNVLVSATIRRGNQFEILQLGKLKKIQIITSQEILDEVKEVLSRPKFGFPENQIKEIVEEIKNLSIIVYPTDKVDIVKEDPDDNRIIECAIAGKADYIISGDNHLLELKEYLGIKIVNSADFMKLHKF